MKKNNQKGITLVALTITIIILIILAGITFNVGKESIRKANIEELKTNMLLIETKAKEYVENASFKLGVNPDANTMYNDAEEYLTGDDKGENINKENELNQKIYAEQINEAKNIGIAEQDINAGKVYILSTDNIKNMGINDVESNNDEGWYIIVYNIEETTAEIYNTIGINEKYSLTDIEQIEL